MLLRRGPRLSSPLSSTFQQSPSEVVPVSIQQRSVSPIYPGGRVAVYPVGAVEKVRRRLDRALEVLGDGEYHHASELRRKLGSEIDCVASMGELLDSGYFVDRSGSYLRLRRRGQLEKRQSSVVVLDGLDLGDVVVVRSSVENVPEGMVCEEESFDVGGDAMAESVVEGLVLSDPASMLTLPVEGSASMTGAILARKGSGKSYLGMVLIEEFMARLEGVAVVVFDPTGVWWGLLSTTMGEPSSYGAILLGGPRGHAKITSGSGAKVADVINAVRPRPVIVDLSELAPSEQHELVADFCEKLIGLPHFPVHVVFDEADEFAPQRLGSISKHQKRSLGYVERMVMRGRSRGIGVTLISLRPAVISKNVLSQVDVLWLLQMTAPQDLRAVEDWLTHFEHKVTERQRDECLSQLPLLPVGTAYFLRGGERSMFRRFKVRHKGTYDSSKTLVVGASDSPILSELPDQVVRTVREVLMTSVGERSSEDSSGGG